MAASGAPAPGSGAGALGLSFHELLAVIAAEHEELRGRYSALALENAGLREALAKGAGAGSVAQPGPTGDLGALRLSQPLVAGLRSKGLAGKPGSRCLRDGAVGPPWEAACRRLRFEPELGSHRCWHGGEPDSGSGCRAAHCPWASPGSKGPRAAAPPAEPANSCKGGCVSEEAAASLWGEPADEAVLAPGALGHAVMAELQAGPGAVSASPGMAGREASSVTGAAAAEALAAEVPEEPEELPVPAEEQPEPAQGPRLCAGGGAGEARPAASGSSTQDAWGVPTSQRTLEACAGRPPSPRRLVWSSGIRGHVLGDSHGFRPRALEAAAEGGLGSARDEDWSDWEGDGDEAATPATEGTRRQGAAQGMHEPFMLHCEQRHSPEGTPNCAAERSQSSP
mmetsp:Transcript_116371/g.361544  ORF Transcript_116371/g.361544 Transcript_116371/m.361544 type:complete len:396 (+) Transcript_116371:68-1255(+)